MFGLKTKKQREEELDYEEQEYQDAEEKLKLPHKRKFRDLNPENRKKRKEPIKPWTKKERLLVLYILLFTTLTSALLAISARDWKLPGLPKINLSKLNFSLSGGEVILENNKKVKGTQDEKYQQVLTDFKAKTDNLSGTYGFYVYQLGSNSESETGNEYGTDEDEIFQAASLVKLPIMVALYQEKPEGYKLLSSKMGKQSDNQAFRDARKVLGDDKINETIQEIGMHNTTLVENETTLEDMGLFFRKLYRNDLLPEEETQEIIKSLTDTIYEEHLAKGIPTDIQVAHKYGREIHVVNDGGIVYLKDKPYIVVIMTKGVVEKEADDIFPELSKLIYEFERIKF